MTNDRLERAVTATDRLRDAVLSTRPSANWFADERTVADLVRHSTARWAHDAGNTFREYHEALTTADSAGPGEDPDKAGAHSLEQAFVHAVSIRDRLRSLAALVLGSRCLKPAPPGVRFDPSEADLRRRLSELAANGHRRAGKVKTLLEQAADHPAIDTRNAILHALAPFPQLTETCWINLAHVDHTGSIRHWAPGPLYPKGTLDQGDAQPETLYRWALNTATDAYDLLTTLADELATLIEETGEIEPPPRIYRRPDGSVQLHRP